MAADRLTLTRGEWAILAFTLAYVSGFTVFFLAPAIGMPPEIPGAEVAQLQGRQLWWLLTVMCTGAGLGLIAFGRNVALNGVGIVVLLVPHAVRLLASRAYIEETSHRIDGRPHPWVQNRITAGNAGYGLQQKPCGSRFHPRKCQPIVRQDPQT